MSSSTSSWYEFGAQGETRSITNASGTTTDTYNYNGYGDLIASSGSTTNPYRYGGKYGYYTETYTGLILATQRWYSPNMMRWISRDPIGFEGGVNLYEYVEGDPINYSDATGFVPVKNNSGHAIPYKPENGDNPGNNLRMCAPGKTCNMDGYYPPGRKRPPVKLTRFQYCKPAIDKDFNLRGCIPYIGCYEVGEDFFRKNTNWPNPYSGSNGWGKRGRKIP